MMRLFLLIPFLWACTPSIMLKDLDSIQSKKFKNPSKIVQNDIKVKSVNGLRLSAASAKKIRKTELSLLVTKFIPRFAGGTVSNKNDLLLRKDAALELGARKVKMQAKDSNGDMQSFRGVLLINQLLQDAKGPVAKSYAITLPPNYIDAVAEGRSIVYYEKIAYSSFKSDLKTYAWILWAGP